TVGDLDVRYRVWDLPIPAEVFLIHLGVAIHRAAKANTGWYCERSDTSYICRNRAPSRNSAIATFVKSITVRCYVTDMIRASRVLRSFYLSSFSVVLGAEINGDRSARRPETQRPAPSARWVNARLLPPTRWSRPQMQQDTDTPHHWCSAQA